MQPYERSCITCNSNCKTCTLTSCLSCYDGKYIAEGDCLPCKDNCLNCT